MFISVYILCCSQTPKDKFSRGAAYNEHDIVNMILGSQAYFMTVYNVIDIFSLHKLII